MRGQSRGAHASCVQRSASCRTRLRSRMPRSARKMRALPARIDYVKNYVDNMPRLIISGTAHELAEDLITVGRSPDNMIVINDPSVSTHHAQLQRAGETYRLKDLDSTNGTRVNDLPAAETSLRFGDRIRFGAAEARYEPDMSGSQPLPQPEKIIARSAELSAVPADFINASPFPRQREENDSFRTAISIALAVLALIFLGSMIAVLTMHAPSL